MAVLREVWRVYFPALCSYESNWRGVGLQKLTNALRTGSHIFSHTSFKTVRLKMSVLELLLNEQL